MSEKTNRQISSTLQWSLFTVLLGFLIFFIVLFLVWLLVDLLTPVLVGLLLAFIFRPLINWARRRLAFPAWLTVTILLVLIAAAAAALGIYFVPIFLEQAAQLFQHVPDYIESFWEHISGQEITLDEEIREKFSDAGAIPMILRGTVKSIGLIAGALGAVSWAMLYIILLLVFFVAFSLYLPAFTDWCFQFLPHSRRDRIVDILNRIYYASGVFLRTRLIIAVILCVIFSGGWAIAGVPYWLLLGTLTGILNIIPYASTLGWLAAMLVNGFEAQSLHGLFYALLWPSVVFAVGQFLDGWVLTPLFQSKTLRINAVIVLLAVIAGGMLAGILGMLLAIPLVAAWQILFSEIIKPQLLTWAKEH